jgi:flagellar biosynthesis/type III secretory pathway protein FliH
MSPEATVFRLSRPSQLSRLTPLAAEVGSAREHERAVGYAAGWAAGARAAAEQAAQQRAALAAAHEAEEARRSAAVQAAVDKLARAAAAADARALPVVNEVRAALVDAAVALAAAVIGRELADGPASAVAALGRALASGADLGVHTVRLSPADHAALVADGVELPAGVTLVADPRLARGDAISEHPAGFLDAQVATALDRARRALLGEDA